MKTITCIAAMLLCITISSSQAQQTSYPSTDSTTRFHVSGACEQCKDRIEKAVKIKGVISGQWDVNTQQLTLEFDPSKTSVEKIIKRIVAVGHDVDEIKASNKVYGALPACCHYRELNGTTNEAQAAVTGTIAGLIDSAIVTQDGALHAPGAVRGVVLETDNKGQLKPLAGATIQWLGSSNGTFTDADGVFSIATTAAGSKLLISYAGYQSDTVTANAGEGLKIIMATNQVLNEVLITTKQHSTYLSALSPVRVQVMNEKELFKAACCNLSESFETNPSVDVSYNDAVTGSKQIQLLGLAGNYTQLTVENLPGPRGIATALGLNSIAGPWIESIQLSKGTGSVANGFESIAGQINIELKKPEKSEALFANGYLNGAGKSDINLNLAKKLGTKWSTLLLMHDDFLTNTQLDFNKDGFRDLPTGNQLSLVNRWKYEGTKGLMTQFGVKFLTDKKTGGETAFDANTDKYTQNRYGLGITTRRIEAFAKIGYVFPAKRYKSIGLQLSGIHHHQESYFGLTNYDARQKSLYSNLIYQSIINNSNHLFRTGISFQYDQYDETLKANQYLRTEAVPGAFFEYTYKYMDKVSAVVGLRTDHHNLYGWFITPRLNLKYEPVHGTVVHLSAGRGQRTANIFAENMSVLVSARQLIISGTQTGGAYGLAPEVAWNKGISIDQKFRLFKREALLSVDFFRNDFTNQVITDIENPRLVKFYNLQGKSFSNSLQVALNLEPLRDLELRFAYRYFDVRSTIDGKLVQRPLVAAHRAFSNIAYAIHGWKFDYTISYNGKKRIPSTLANPVNYQMSAYSPAYVLMNAQISKTVSKKIPLDLYLGVENLGNYYQRTVIVAADQPFSPYFDASLVWGPVTGRMLYAGFRLKIK